MMHEADFGNMAFINVLKVNTTNNASKMMRFKTAIPLFVERLSAMRALFTKECTQIRMA